MCKITRPLKNLPKDGDSRVLDEIMTGASADQSKLSRLFLMTSSDPTVSIHEKW
jgi:hypothetical protein